MPSTSELSTQLGADVTVKWPETNPPVLSKLLFDRIKVGMSLEEVLATVRETLGKSFLTDQPPSNPVRYDLTITQGKRRILLNFRNNKLVDKWHEGLE
jgi:hypothetical protein